MKNKILALAFLLVALPAFAQNPATNPVAGNLSSATAGSVAMLVKYVGTAAPSATTDVEVEAGGNMVFRVAGAADALVNTAAAGALCGATPGTLDLSTPAATCNSLGEVVDVINASGDWIAVLVDGMRDDLSDNTLTVMAVAAGAKKNGVAIYSDEGVALHPGLALLPSGCQTNINCFVTPQGKLIENPSGGKLIDLRWVAGYNTWNTTSNFYIYSVKVANRKGGGTETATTLWQEATGATGTNKQLTQFQYFGLLGRPHEKVIVRMVVTATMSAPVLQAYGVERSVN
jgi:hypothetical protein